MHSVQVTASGLHWRHCAPHAARTFVLRAEPESGWRETAARTVADRIASGPLPHAVAGPTRAAGEIVARVAAEVTRVAHLERASVDHAILGRGQLWAPRIRCTNDHLSSRNASPHSATLPMAQVGGEMRPVTHVAQVSSGVQVRHSGPQTAHAQENRQGTRGTHAGDTARVLLPSTLVTLMPSPPGW